MSDPWLTTHIGDCREVLATLTAESVHCVVTSLPILIDLNPEYLRQIVKRTQQAPLGLVG